MKSIFFMNYQLNFGLFYYQVISGTRNKSTITRTTDFGKSPISDIFGGKLKVRVHREGDHSSDNIEPFFTLKLVIEVSSHS